MWFKLAGADFSKNNLGTMSSISSSYLINYSKLTGMSGTPTSVSYAGSSAGTAKNVEVTITVTSGYSFKNGSKITASGGATGAVFTADKDYVGGSTFKFSMNVTGNVELTGAAEAVSTGGGSSSGGGGSEGGGETTDPTPGGNNYIDITTQGTEKGSIKDSVITIPDSSSLYVITKVQLPSNAVSVEYQAFKTGGSYGSAFVNDAGTVVKFLPKTNVTTGDRVTEIVPSGATWFYHMYDDPAENEKQTAPAFTYIRVYTSGESGGGSVEGLPMRITEQNQTNNKMLDVSTGTVTSITDSGTGAQTITVCDIPSGATTVNYQVFKTGKTYGSGFFNADGEFISGYVNSTADSGTRHTLTIPAGAATFWHMYPNKAYANTGGSPEFDYIEFA